MILMIDYGGWHLDLTTLIMLYTIQLSKLGWDYCDGAKEKDKLNEGILKTKPYSESKNSGKKEQNKKDS